MNENNIHSTQPIRQGSLPSNLVRDPNESYSSSEIIHRAKISPLARQPIEIFYKKMQLMPNSQVSSSLLNQIYDNFDCFREVEGEIEDHEKWYMIVAISYIEDHIDKDNPRDCFLKKFALKLKGEETRNKPFVYFPTITGTEHGNEFIDYLIKYCGGNGILRSTRHMQFAKALNNHNFVKLMTDIFYDAYQTAGKNCAELSTKIGTFRLEPSALVPPPDLSKASGFFTIQHTNKYYLLNSNTSYRKEKRRIHMPPSHGDDDLPDPTELIIPIKGVGSTVGGPKEELDEAIANATMEDEIKKAIYIVSSINSCLINAFPDYQEMIESYINLELLSEDKLYRHLSKMQPIEELVNSLGELKLDRDHHDMLKTPQTNNKRLLSIIQEFKYFITTPMLKEKIKYLNPCLEHIKMKCDRCLDNSLDNPRVKLDCKHVLCSKCLINRVKELEDGRKTTLPFQIQCLSKSCFYMLSQRDIEELTGSGSREESLISKHRVGDPYVRTTQCGICMTELVSSNIRTLHYDPSDQNCQLQHNVCDCCLRGYISYMTEDRIVQIDFYRNLKLGFEAKHCIIPIKCPFRNCHMVIDYHQLVQLYQIHQVEYMIDKAFEEKGIMRNIPEGENNTLEIMRGDGVLAHDTQKLAKCYICKTTINLAQRFPNCNVWCRKFCCKDHLKNLGDDIKKNGGKCSECCAQFNHAFVTQIYNAKVPIIDGSILYRVPQEVGELVQTQRLKDLKLKCEICQENRSAKEVVSLWDCQHRYCKECLKQYIETLYKDGKCISQVICPSPGCHLGNIRIHTIKELCGTKIASGFEARFNKLKRESITCPRCDSVNSLFRSIKDVIITCGDCKMKFCRFCNEQPHSGSCLEVARQFHFKLCKEAQLYVASCPYCLQIFTKDNSCNHVKCYNCQRDFCFKCSCKRQPSLVHGSHYHRENCNFYSRLDRPDTYSFECTECDHTRKKPCKRPLRLEAGDIPASEKPIIQYW